MSYRTYVWLAVSITAFTEAGIAQLSVDQVLDKYTQSVGGRAAWEKVTTRAMKGTVEIPDDNVTAPLQILAKASGAFRLTMDIPGYGIVETVLDGSNGWEKNPDSGLKTMSQTDLANARRDHNFYRAVRLKELYAKMALLGDDKVEGRAVHVIEATPPKGPAEKLYFDSETGLLLKQDFERVTLEDGIVQFEMLFRDYRDVDGLKLPFLVEQHSPDNTMIFKFAEVRNNATLEDAAFARPDK